MWTDLYKELAEIITDEVQNINWVDLWHDQVYEEGELPFPTPAVFIAFRTLECQDLGQLIQECDTQIDLYLFYETFSDTYAGAYNQESALNFLNLLTEIHKVFHGRSGNTFQTMRRINIEQVETGGSGNLYRLSFNCLIKDSSAVKEFEKAEVKEVVVSNTPLPQKETDGSAFIIP